MSSWSFGMQYVLMCNSSILQLLHIWSGRIFSKWWIKQKKRILSLGLNSLRYHTVPPFIPVTFQTGQEQHAPQIRLSKRQSELHIPIWTGLMECSATKLCCLNQSLLENVWEGRVVVPYLYRCHSVRTSNSGWEWVRWGLCNCWGGMAGTLVSKACQSC